ncbi:hypothetical protein LEL_10524 [Akanthomyces lecanii RCEF 1005]|uniref:Uncharacterized protein n=1 Tax=Akanthomyces lecanii RCEF 1005 TaxID=1081108 RepID=A0A167XK97_CORDF|nr:hypothetical protein LEL_10524 [Akanthomyces lecanii RCEF 1005]
MVRAVNDLNTALERVYNSHSKGSSDSNDPIKPAHKISIGHLLLSPVQLPRPELTHAQSSRSISVQLPSLREFDRGVNALVKANGGHVRPWSPATPRKASMALWAILSPPPPPPARLYTLSECLGQIEVPRDEGPVGGLAGPPTHARDGNHSPTVDEVERTSPRYTIEEGDFIIYAFCDKKLSWYTIHKEFTAKFRRDPERSVQALQAWFYRTNQQIPVWDQDGALVFESDTDMEPKQKSSRCNSQGRAINTPGLAQRYPERAVHYDWVDPDLKLAMSAWGGYPPKFVRVTKQC